MSSRCPRSRAKTTYCQKNIFIVWQSGGTTAIIRYETRQGSLHRRTESMLKPLQHKGGWCRKSQPKIKRVPHSRCIEKTQDARYFLIGRKSLDRENRPADLKTTRIQCQRRSRRGFCCMTPTPPPGNLTATIHICAAPNKKKPSE